MKKRFLITGVSGLMGRCLVEYLDKKICEIYGLDRKLVLFNDSENVDNFIQCDLNNTSDVASFIRDIRPDFICHLAACIKHCKNEIEYYNSNLLGTNSLFESIIRANVKPKILVIGSSAEYGFNNEKYVDESCPLNPITHYGISKVSEFFLSNMYRNKYGLPIIYLRVFNHVAPSQDSGLMCSFYAKEVAAIEKKQKDPTLIVRNPNHIRDIVDTRDVVRSIDMFALSRIEDGEYNICSGKGVSVMDVVKYLKKISLSEVSIKVDNSISANSTDILFQIGDFSKARLAVDWTPKISLDETLLDILNYWRENI